MKAFRWLLIACLMPFALLIQLPARASSLELNPPDSQNPARAVHFDQRLGEKIPLDTTFTNERGVKQSLQGEFGKLPVLLVFAYYRCPNLCTLVLNGLTTALRGLPDQLGKDFRVVTVSIDPRETSALALAKQRSYLARLGKVAAPDDAWSFLTGTEKNIRNLADSAGFHYGLDMKSGEYSHPSGIIVLTPRGIISQYFFGIQFDPALLHRALQAAAAEKRGSWVEEILLYCFHYDPALSRNGKIIMTSIRLTGAVGGILVLALILTLFLKSKKETLA